MKPVAARPAPAALIPAWLGLTATPAGCRLDVSVTPNARRAVTLLRGDSARRKQLLIDLPQGQMAACLAKLMLPGAE